MRNQKHRKAATHRMPARPLPPRFSDDPAHDDPHDAVDQELLGIWLSISRLRQLIRARPPLTSDARVVALHRQAAQKKPPRKAA